MVVVAALVLRWPEAVLGDDQKAVERLPERRLELWGDGQEFAWADGAYEDYIRTHNMGAMLGILKRELPMAREQIASNVGDPQAELQTVLVISSELLNYVDVLRRYAETGERYLDAMRRYDDDLMAWTRSLGAASEGLRDDTFPIVEHLKLYPPPTGLRADPPLVTAAQVAEQGERLRESYEALSGSASAEVRIEHLNALEKAVDDIWASGRSIEYIESLHFDYHNFLKQYDETVTRVASTQAGSSSPSAPALAANLAVGLTVLAGLGLLFGARGVRAEA